MKEKDLPMDRTRHAVYTKNARKCVQRLLHRYYDDARAAELWEKIQLQYCAFLEEEPPMGGAKIRVSIYDPILIFAWHQLGRGMAVKTIVCTLAYSLFYSLIPVPKAPIVEDYLTACLLGGILTGVGCGIVLTCGCSSGGLDVIGLCLSRRGSGFTVGRFSLTFNVFLYAACLILFSPEVAIYSVIYNFFASIVLDRMHQQNVNVLALIFTREDPSPLSRYIMDRLGRGATCWEGTGAYTGAGVHVLCVCLTKYEIDQLLHAVRTMDPTAFLTVQKGVQVWVNFPRKLG